MKLSEIKTDDKVLYEGRIATVLRVNSRNLNIEFINDKGYRSERIVWPKACEPLLVEAPKCP